MKIKINDFIISDETKPFVIAEMSGNHNQSIERAFEIIDAAASAGAHAVKLQTYTADTITLNQNKGLFNISDKNSLWNGKNLYQLYKEAYTPWEWHKELFDYAKKKNLIIFSSPFDESAVDFLETLDCPIYKIASFENNHFPLLKKVAATGKPVIMSTGISNLSDIYKSVNVLKSAGCKELVLLKCTSTYPASPENTNVRTIPVLKEIFKCIIGLSDHTMGIGASIAAISLGARVIEKHFTLRRADGGVDSAFSLEPDELKSLVVESERAFLSLGKIQFDITEAEKKSINFKRSIYVSSDIKKGEVFSEQNLKIVRPGDGLHPEFFEMLIGKKASSDISAGTPVNWNLIVNDK